jgi:hypothetical protein
MFRKALATHIGVQIIEGSGSNGQALGLAVDTTNVTTNVTNTSGGTRAWTTICDTIAAVEAAAGDGALAWVVTATAAKIMRQRAIISGGEAMLADGRVGGYPAIVIGGTTSATAVFGRWKDLVVYEWVPIEVATNPFANFKSGIMGVRGWTSFNAAPLVYASFATITSVT